MHLASNYPPWILKETRLDGRRPSGDGRTRESRRQIKKANKAMRLLCASGCKDGIEESPNLPLEILQSNYAGQEFDRLKTPYGIRSPIANPNSLRSKTVMAVKQITQSDQKVQFYHFFRRKRILAKLIPIMMGNQESHGLRSRNGC